MPGATPLSTSDFPRHYRNRVPYIKMLIGPDDWPEADQQWERYFNMQSSSRIREEFLYYAGFGRFVEMGENDAVTYDKIVQGPKKSVEHRLWGLGFQIGYKAAKYDLDKLISRNAPQLGYAMRQSVQSLAAEFYNGLAATYTTADGQFILDGSHTYVRGSGTFSNLSNSTLSQEALENGLIAFKNQKDLMGNPQPLKAKTVLTAPDLEPLLHEILMSPLRSDTTTNATNFMKGQLSPESWPWIDSATQWTILAPRESLKIFWIWNIKPETTHGYDFDREAAKTKVLFAQSVVGVDPRGIYGYATT